ncbi:MAG: hypothetical protein ACK5EU_14940 [Pseudanabaena sp.]|jgi:hypothetical protein|nr:hypothetical protein [Pseudanabaena sp. M53BS1SP1A06MG]MCA6580865.1 hypothetical protein [Pseudanabaena sp. M34BS1SP1A06MG]MCA6586697.1 hypothetical protein [Pseudanabaena sp. M051S1SP1A06QC]MCA6588582.1 hypothetical protein [Pseudanabaena sp. M109S1SP1A06QC]MCA6594018.1 hypothetical protein [Pseudanabaena sp. M38BS1SP1A06MG]MCA6597820.1 hypothetical protein [Pseudanabaena sp. M046S1SP1A06QC]MCA6602457.1 hypothetical protein [Pseudanabaena sp. M57BS1SP1A06MG]MCA6604462.1 hypothetical prot
MATPHRTKQVNLRFPLPLLSQVKSQADAKQQAIADWILAVVSREFSPEPTATKAPEPAFSEPAPFVLHPELAVYVESCLAPLQTQVVELRTQLGESNA